MDHNSQTRWFKEYESNEFLMKRQAGVEPLRLVIHLHGATQSMRSVPRDWLKLADEHGFLVLAPNGVGRMNKYNTYGNDQVWNDILATSHPDIDDVGFVVKLVNWAITERNIDPRFVYVSGISNGGIMTYRLLHEQPQLFAAASSIVANMPQNEMPLPVMGTPIMILSGTKDPIIKWDGCFVSVLGGTVSSVETTRNYWISANHVDENVIEANQLENYNKYDNCIISSKFYNKANDSSTNACSPVLFYTMEGGGHRYPIRSKWPFEIWFIKRIYGPLCRDANGIDLAWNFMSKFSKNSTDHCNVS